MPTPPASRSERAHVLIVDGHSMIFQWPELRRLHQRKTAIARQQLITLLTRYQDTSGTKVLAVFDGKGERTNEASEPGGIQVFYSGAAKTADSVIERIVAKYASIYAITVATDDNLERQTVESFGGEWMSSEQLALELRDADTRLQDQIKHLKRR